MYLTKSLRENTMLFGTHWWLIAQKYNGMINECLEKCREFFSCYFSNINALDLCSDEGVRGSIVSFMRVLQRSVYGLVCLPTDFPVQ